MNKEGKKAIGIKKEEVFINVKPLRSAQEIADFKWALRYTGKERDVMLFTFGLNTGLRVSDIIGITVKEVRGKTHFKLREQKTQKIRDVYLNDGLREDIAKYIRFLDDSDYLFPSQKGGKPISTTQAYRIMQKAADVLERDDIGTHTMRKTFGYMHYKRNKDVAVLQEIFNHSSPAITLRYIGITDEDIEKSQEGFYL